jgi:hypothetical protein
MNASPRLSLELDRVPVQILLDGLRTVRSGIDASLEAGGIMSGKISYAPVADAAPPARHVARANRKAAKPHSPVPGPLSGSVIASSVRLTGDNLTKPIQVTKITIEPAPGEPPALATTVAIPAGAPAPLILTVRLSLVNYQVGVRGAASLPRLRELALAAGMANSELLGDLDGPPATLDVNADGPWLRAPIPPQPASPSTPEGPEVASVKSPAILVPGTTDRLSGTVTLHGTAWKPNFLAGPVQITSATLHLDGAESRWESVGFSYGPVAGNAMLELPIGCDAATRCLPQFALRFKVLDAAALQAAILGAPRPGTLISGLLERIRPSTAPAWPEIEGTVQADALILGPVTFDKANASVRIGAANTELTAFDAALMGGNFHAEGTMTPGEKPAYKVEGRFDKVRASELGLLLGMTWTGEGVNGTGHIELSGFTDQDLASSAKGTLHFDWRSGAITDAGDAGLPPVLSRFDRWTADAEIAKGAITVTQNQVQRGARKVPVEASAIFGDPPRVSFGAVQNASTAKR